MMHSGDHPLFAGPLALGVPRARLLRIAHRSSWRWFRLAEPLARQRVRERCPSSILCCASTVFCSVYGAALPLAPPCGLIHVSRPHPPAQFMRLEFHQTSSSPVRHGPRRSARSSPPAAPAATLPSAGGAGMPRARAPAPSPARMAPRADPCTATATRGSSGPGRTAPTPAECTSLRRAPARCALPNALIVGTRGGASCDAVVLETCSGLTPRPACSCF